MAEDSLDQDYVGVCSPMWTKCYQDSAISRVHVCVSESYESHEVEHTTMWVRVIFQLVLRLVSVSSETVLSPFTKAMFRGWRQCLSKSATSA